MRYLIIIVIILNSLVSVGQVQPIGSPYAIGQNLANNVSTQVTTNSIRVVQGIVMPHYSDTLVANALPYVKNYPYTIISVDTNIVYMRNWNATKWMYMPVEGQVVNGDTIHYLIRVNRRPGSDSVFGKYYNGVTTFESFQFIDSTGPGNTGWRITGNAGTSPGTNFIGTTDGQGLMFKVSNIQSGFIDLLLSNTSFGFRSLTNDVGGDNTAFGFNSLRANTDGFRNTAVGNAALEGNTVGQENVAVGHQAMALGQEGTYNTAIGPYSLYNNTTGYSNVGLGKNSGLANTTGFQNTFVGAGSGEANTTGQENTFVGYDAGLNNVTGLRNTYVGWNAKGSSAGIHNTSIGYSAGRGVTDSAANNVFVGESAGYHASQKIDADNTVALGSDTYTTANNQVVIGNDNITQTRLRGAIYFNGDAGTSGYLLKSNGTGAAPTWVTAASVAPTWQQTLTAGSTLTDNNIIDVDDNEFTLSRAREVTIGAGISSSTSELFFSSTAINSTVTTNGRRNMFYLSGDTIFAKPGLGLLYVDTLTNVPGTRALRYNPTTGLVSYADTSSGGGVALSAITAATGSNSINNANNPQVWAWNSFDGDGNHGLMLTANTTASVGPTGLLGVSVQGANASSTITTSAGTFQNIHTGTGSTNIGVDLDVSGGATANYATRANTEHRLTHNGFGVRFDNGGYLHSSGATGQTTVGMTFGSGAATIYTTTDIYGQTGGTARWRTVAAGTYFGNSVASATSQLQSEGSFAAAITTTSSNITLDATHHSVILTSGTPTITLPAASGCSGRIYNIVNQTAGALTISSYIDYTSGAATIIPSHSGLKVQSNGTSWYQIGM